MDGVAGGVLSSVTRMTLHPPDVVGCLIMQHPGLFISLKYNLLSLRMSRRTTLHTQAAMRRSLRREPWADISRQAPLLRQRGGGRDTRVEASVARWWHRDGRMGGEVGWRLER